MKSEDNFYDHYKDTLSLQQTYLSERNKLTMALLILPSVYHNSISDNENKQRKQLGHRLF